VKDHLADMKVTGIDMNFTNVDVNVTGSDVNVTGSDVNVTIGDVDVTTIDMEGDVIDVKVTDINMNVTIGDVNVAIDAVKRAIGVVPGNSTTGFLSVGSGCFQKHNRSRLSSCRSVVCCEYFNCLGRPDLCQLQTTLFQIFDYHTVKWHCRLS
jgi:hypothetical protein